MTEPSVSTKVSALSPTTPAAASPALSGTTRSGGVVPAPQGGSSKSRWNLAIQTLRSNRDLKAKASPGGGAGMAATPGTGDEPSSARSVMSNKVTQNLRKWHKQVIYRDLERGQGLRVDRKHKQWLTAQLDRVTADLPEPLRVSTAEESAPIVAKIAESYERYLGGKNPITLQARARQAELERVSRSGCGRQSWSKSLDSVG